MMKKNRALIITGGSISIEFAVEFLKEEAFDLVIAVDSGLVAAKRLNIPIQYIVGDFDSVPKETIDYYKNKVKLRASGDYESESQEQEIIIKEYNPMKDDTDTEIAIRLCIERMADEIVIIGATGSRIDHMLANIQLLLIPLRNRIRASIIDEHNKIYLIDENTSLNKNTLHGPFISLLPLTETVKGISLCGFKYPLNNYEMHLGGSLGVSNEMTGDRAEITLQTGILIVIEAKD
jgi:thiamine pyrophosphokinase